MHTWNELLSEKQNFDFEWRKTYLQALNDYTKRDVIVYYSAWQTKSGPSDLLSITQDDRTSFQAAIDSMLPDSKELDLIIHTPGGEVQATKMIVHALRSKYEHIRVIIPHTAMSAGTMIALSADEIVLARNGNMGPTDPQLPLSTINAMVPANEIINVIMAAQKDITVGQNIQYWMAELLRYPATLGFQAKKVIAQCSIIVQGWLRDYMFKGDPDAQKKAQDVETYFSNAAQHLTHGSSITYEEISSNLPNLKIKCLDDDPTLRDLVLGLFYCFDIFMMSVAQVVKICESHRMVGRVKIYNGK